MDELLILKQAKLDVVTFQIQNTELTKLNHALPEQLKEEKKINEKWLTSSKKVSQCISEQIPHQKKKVLGGELLTESLSKINLNENVFIPASMDYDHEMVPKSKDWVERLNPDSKLPNFNTGRILVLESQAVNESLKPTEASTDHESSKDYEVESLTPLPPLKILQGDSPSSEILKAKANPFPPCTHCSFNDHRPDDCKNYLECDICRSYDHFTSGHNHVIHIRGGILAESSQSRESSIGVECTCGSTIHSTTDHNEFDHFKREIHQGAHLVPRQWMLKEYDWCQELSAQICRATSISQLCDAKYIVQFDDKQGTIFNANKEIVLIAPRRNYVYVLGMSSLTPNRACFFAKVLESDGGKNDVKVKQIKTDNGTEFRNHELESFCNEKGISQNFSSPYTPEQNGVAERKNKTLIEAARTMLDGSVLSKHLWTGVVRIVCYTQNRSIIIKRHDKTLCEIFRERIPDISYFHVFGCHVFIHNHKDHLGKFDAKADDGYFLGYSFVSKAFRVFNTRRQQVEETYHVTFDESMKAIRFTNTSVDEIGIDDSSRYPPNEFIHEDDPSRQYQADSDISYYVIPHGRSLTELTQKTCPPDLINTEGTHKQNVQDEQIITQSTKGPSGNNTKVSVSIIESLVPGVLQSHISNQASTSSYLVLQVRWSKDQHIELVNIIGDPGEGMLTRSMAAKLIAASASECIFVDFFSEIEPKRVSETLKHPGWVVAMQEELNQFYINKVWTLVPLPYGKTTIGSKWVEGIDYDETFAPVARMEAIKIFLTFATYMNFIVFQMDVKSAFLNGKLKEEVYVKQPLGFESSEFPDYVCKLDKALYGLKQ
ncbi:retrovirus-related pol polyprotein from transposon TNT 1-94, partial [Tanacetum coccineum]